jgi:hypothetical protein
MEDGTERCSGRPSVNGGMTDGGGGDHIEPHIDPPVHGLHDRTVNGQARTFLGIYVARPLADSGHVGAARLRTP